MTEQEQKIDILKGQSIYPSTGYNETTLTLQQYLIGNLSRNPAIVTGQGSAKRIARKIKEVSDYLIEEMANDASFSGAQDYIDAHEMENESLRDNLQD